MDLFVVSSRTRSITGMIGLGGFVVAGFTPTWIVEATPHPVFIVLMFLISGCWFVALASTTHEDVARRQAAEEAEKRRELERLDKQARARIRAGGEGIIPFWVLEACLDHPWNIDLHSALHDEWERVCEHHHPTTEDDTP